MELLVLQGIVSGLLMGGIYALVAVGLTLTFGVLKIMNFAHGDFMMLAMYATVLWAAGTGLDPYLAGLILLPLAFVAGAAVFQVVVRPIVSKRGVDQMLFMMGLQLLLQNVALAAFSPDYRTVKTGVSELRLFLGPVFVEPVRLVAALVSLAVVGLLGWVLHATDLGRRIRAAAQDREAAALIGIDVQRVYRVAFALGIGCVAVAAPLVAPIFYVVPTVGNYFLLMAFVVVVLGGLGSFRGALVASFIVGLGQELGNVFMPGSTAPMVPFGLFVAMLLFRPEGLFGLRAS